MISEELKAIIDKLKEQGKMIFLEGATEEQIAQFEKDHEIEFPVKNGCSIPMAASCFFPLECSFMV